MSTFASTPRRRGPRRSLTREALVDAALDLLDEAGWAGFSLRAVGNRLGVDPNTLYTYVADRAALEREVAERVLAETDPTALEDVATPWRERVLRYAVRLRATLLRHPGAARLLTTAPMDGPTALLIGERLMDALAEAGLDADDAARASYALMVQVLGAVLLEVAETDGRHPLPSEPERIAARRAGFDTVDAGAWPRTAAASATMAAWISGEQFTWSLDRLLDGLVPRS